MDAYAWIEYLDGTARGMTIGNLIESPKHEILTLSVTLAEVVSKFLRSGKDSQVAVTAMSRNSTVVPVTAELAVLAGELHAEARKKQKDFGLADAFILATAKTRISRILTGDPHFKDYREADMV